MDKDETPIKASDNRLVWENAKRIIFKPIRTYRSSPQAKPLYPKVVAFYLRCST